MKYALLIPILLFCGVRLEITKASYQYDYPGIPEAPAKISYNIEIDNPKEETVEILDIYIRGTRIKFDGLTSNNNPIVIKHSERKILTDSALTVDKSIPNKYSDSNVIVKYRRKKSTGYITFQKLEEIEAIARP